MWHYIKGLLIGFLLLWFLFFVSFAISDGLVKAAIYSGTLTGALFGFFQQQTHGTGIWIALFIILSCWIWNFGKKKQARSVTATSVPGNSLPVEQYERETEPKEEK